MEHLHAVAQAAVVQDRQVKAAAVPAHQLGGVLLDGLEKGLHHFALALAVAIDERVDAQAF